MTTLTELVATVVVQSSAIAFSHFGVTLEPAHADRVTPPAAERVVARTPTPVHRSLKLTTCPKPRPSTHSIHT